MSFFDQSFSLLANTQTFVAAIATLIVLCSFRNNAANFIEKLIESFDDIFINDIKHNVSQLSTQSGKHFSFLKDWRVYYNSADEKEKQQLLEIKTESDLLKVEMYNVSEADKKKAEEKSKEFEDKQRLPKQRLALTQTLMAFYTFVFCIAMLTFDSLKFNSVFSGFLLFFVDFILCAMTLASWLDYLLEKRWTIAKWYRTGSFVLVVILGTIYLWSNYVLVLILTLMAFSAFLFVHIIHKTQKDNYNYRAISKYALYSIMVSFIGAFILYFAVQDSFLYDLAPVELHNFVTISVPNALFLSEQINIWRPIFVVLCVLNAFVLPLMLAYVKGRKKSTGIRKDLYKNYKTALSSLRNIETQYDALKSKINSRNVSSE